MKRKKVQKDCREDKQAEKILDQIARQNGVTAAEVRRDINNSIRQAIAISKLENNRRALELWEQIPCKGDIPTAEEIIPWLAENARKKLNS